MASPLVTDSTTTKIQNEIKSHALFSENRIPSLYSSFEHLIESNHEGYRANVEAWESLLMDIARKGLFPNSLSLSISEALPVTFALSGVGAPQGLSYVLDEAVSEHTFIPASTFENLSYSFIDGEKWWWNISARKIMNATLNTTGLYNPYRFKSWSSQMGLYGRGPRRLISERYILLPLLREASNEILSHWKRQQSSNQTTVYTISEFKRVFRNRQGGALLSSTDLDDLILYISRDLKAALVKDDRYVKLGDYNNLASDISESEKAVADIEETLGRINDRIDSITKQLMDIDSQLKIAAIDSSKNQTSKSKALYLLRSRKLADISLKKALDAQSQVSQARDSLIAAGTNLDIVRTLESSLPVLKKLNEGVGNVDQLVEEFQQEHKQTQEIGDIISSISTEGKEQVDDEEIEAELQGMAQSEAAIGEGTDISLSPTQQDVDANLQEQMEKLSMQTNQSESEEKEKEKERRPILESS